MSDSEKKTHDFFHDIKRDKCCNHLTFQDFHGFTLCSLCVCFFLGSDTEEDYPSNAHHSSWCGVLEKESEL